MSRVEDALHEISKPLARHKDDEDLDDLLRRQERSLDPMLSYIKKKSNKSTNKVKGRMIGLPFFLWTPPSHFIPSPLADNVNFLSIDKNGGERVVEYCSVLPCYDT